MNVTNDALPKDPARDWVAGVKQVAYQAPGVPPSDWSEEQQREAAAYLAQTCATFRLRGYQDLNAQQSQTAWNDRNTRALRNLQVMWTIYALAVSIREFGDDVDRAIARTEVSA